MKEENDVQKWCAAVVGEGIEEAEAIARDSGFVARRVRVDGQPRIVTHDLRQDRINFEVQGGKVQRAYLG
jgi:hypothetical protein